METLGLPLEACTGTLQVVVPSSFLTSPEVNIMSQPCLVRVAGASESAILGPFEALYADRQLIAAIPLGFAIRSGEFGAAGATVLWSNTALRERAAKVVPPQGSHIVRTPAVPIILPPVRYQLRHELGITVTFDPMNRRLEFRQDRCVVQFLLDANSNFQFEHSYPEGICPTATFEEIRSGFEQALYPDGAL